MELSAQQTDLAHFGYSVLALVPVVGDPIAGEAEVSGMLGSTDLRTSSGMVVQAYELQGTRGQPFSIDVASTDFDAYLMLLGPGYTEPLTDDDSGGACNARLTVFLPDDGPFRVLVGSLAGEVGAYTLRVDEREHPATQGDCGAATSDPAMMRSLTDLVATGDVSLGSTIEAELLIDGPALSDGSPAQVYEFSGEPGQTVWVDAISVDFDPFLYVAGPGITGFMSDDDTGGQCNARVRFVASESGSYRIAIRALGEGTGGLFTLRVSDSEQADEPGAC